MIWLLPFSWACVVVAACATAAAQDRSNSTLVRVEGGGAPAGLGLLLQGLERENRLEWRSVTVTEQDATLSALLSRINGWPSGAVAASTDALVCSRNAHVCCPVAQGTKGARDKCVRALATSTNNASGSFLNESQESCKVRLTKFAAEPAKAKDGLCESVWRFTVPSKNALTLPACGEGAASPWEVCLPVVRVREQVGVQELAFNPRVDKSVRAKYEEMQGCAELLKGEQANCRASFSVAKLNAFNYGDYRARALHEGRITLPVRAYTVEIPALKGQAKPPSVEKALDGVRDAHKIHDRPSLKIEWMNKRAASILRAQQGPSAAEDAQAARTLEALKIMGFDAKAPRVQRPATILAIDLSPLFKGNPRLPETSVNAFSVYEISGRSKLQCPKGSKIAYKPQEWAAKTTFKAPDHATEVIGVMAAKQTSSSQVFGALSSVINSGSVHALYVDDGKGEPDDQTTVDTIFELKPVAAFMAAGCSTTTFPVVNVSLKFSSLGRENASADYEGVLFGRASEAQYALFIVAAGNPEDLKATRTKTSADCDHLPGCKALNTQNMVSVMGLDLTGEVPSRSSLYGAPFEVAAIGDIWTIRRDGRERPVGGSSYATPFVTSLASLIVGKAYMLKANGGMIQPPDVKTRILQTVDFLRDTSVVRFGRVNFSRAIDIGRDILVLDAALPKGDPVGAPYCNGSAHCYVGDVDKADSVSLLEGYDGEGKKIKVEPLEFDRVLRLKRSGANKWDVVYLPPVRDSMIPMRLKNATLVGLTHLSFLSSGGSSFRVPISAVKDYTRCMWRKGSDGVCIKGA